MARKARNTQNSTSDDDDNDAPEIVSRSTSKADAKRTQKALRDFEAEERVRRKARNRERDQKLKERARAMAGKGGKPARGVRFLVEGEGSEGDSSIGVDNEFDGDNDKDDDVEARMLKAMREAADEVESGEGEMGNDDDDGEDEKDDRLVGLGQGMDSDDDIASESDRSSARDEDTEMGEDESRDPEAETDDEEMREDEEDDITPSQSIDRPNKKADYLADDLFAAAFASKNSKSIPKKSTKSTQQQATKKRRRKPITRPKDLVVGRTIRTLPRLSDPRSQATSRSIPSARARRFVDNSLAMKGNQALRKARKRGWERRAANVGVMKFQGAPHGFVRGSG